MAGIKISALNPIPSSLLTDVAPFVQAGVTYKASNSQLATLFNSTLSFLPLSGGTLTGNLILNGDPTLALQAATKQYVDAIAQGITVQGACRLASTANLTATYSNGSSGVGATLTNSTTQAALTLDGVAVNTGDRVLIKNQSAQAQNGIYVVSNIGSASTNWVLTRASDYDLVAQINPGDLVVITAGSTQTNSSWLQTDTITSIGTSSIAFTQFTTALPVSVPNGGTGLTSTIANQLLYSSANNVIAGLATANNGILVTSNTGIPSISNTFGQGLSLSSSILNVGGAYNIPFNNSIGIQDVNGNLLLNFTATASAVNYININNAAAGGTPSLGAIGSSTNIILNLVGKGTGGVAIHGTGTNDNPSAGYVGEYVESPFSAINIPTSTNINVTTLILTPGDWDLYGSCCFVASTAGTWSSNFAGVNTVSATFGATGTFIASNATGIGFGTNATQAYSIISQRALISTTTTYYLIAQSTFTTGSIAAYGNFFARRRR